MEVTEEFLGTRAVEPESKRCDGRCAVLPCFLQSIAGSPSTALKAGLCPPDGGRDAHRTAAETAALLFQCGFDDRFLSRSFPPNGAVF